MTTANPDFEAVKTALQFEPVLLHYGIETKGRGPQLSIVCPFHDDHKESCGVNYDRKIFNCFACGASGNALDFVCMMEGLDPEDSKQDLKEGSLIALEIMGLDPDDFQYRKAKAKTPKAKAKRKVPVETRQKKVVKAKPLKTKETSEAEEQEETPLFNKPLDFELQLNPDHQFFDDREISQELVEEFGLGYCNKGIMAGRICIPLHNENGELVGYSGRYAKEDLPEGTTRYKLPKGFQKSLVLFNLHRLLSSNPKHLVLVEGYWSVLRLHSEGIPVVASLGASLSDQQVELMVNAGIRYVTVLYDGDDGGRQGAVEAVNRLSSHTYVRKIDLPDGIKPDVMDEEYLKRLR